MNSQKSFSITLVIILLLAGISFSFKVAPIAQSYENFLPTAVYKVTYNYYSKGKEKKIFVKTYIPESNERQKISKQKEKSKKMSFVIKDEEGNNRAIWRAKDKRKFHSISYSFIFKGKATKYILPENLSLEENSKFVNSKYLNAAEHIEVYHPKIDSVAKNLDTHQNNVKELVTSIFKYVKAIPSAPIRDLTSALTALEQNQASCNGKARLFVALCRNRGIPARLKGGMILEETRKRTSHLWAEIYIQNKWVPFDPLNGHFAYLPAHYLELYSGDHFLITHTPNILFDYNYTIKHENYIPFLNTTSNDKLLSHPLSLIRLSEHNLIPKKVLYFLLLLPLGGLLIALFKNVIGLKTYGVFLPILIAYTLTATGYTTGMLLFVMMTILVAVISAVLNTWGLLYTPKMVVVLTLTVLTILLFINLGIAYKIEWLMALSFFPIIIMAIMAERFARAIEEDGFKDAMNTILQTLLATSACYLVFSSIAIKTTLLVFPELIFVIVIVTLLLGKWIGIRVSEYKRFQAILD